MSSVLAGVDGGRDGAWVVVTGRRGRRGWSPLEGFIAASFTEALDRLAPHLEVLAIDIPIGLPDAPERGGRRAERAARARLGGRASSVFNTPSRAALEVAARLDFDASAFPEASRTNAEASDAGLRLSKQTFFIMPRIFEVDEHLGRSPEAAARTFEVHPELAFLALAKAPLLGKKTFRGKLQRVEALRGAGLEPGSVLGLEDDPRASPDDILDACACLWSADRIARGLAERLPDPAPRDRRGREMAIYF